MNDLQLSNSMLTVDDMWGVLNKEENTWGVPGYEAPKKQFDFKKIKSEREMHQLNLDVWAKKKHYPKPKESLDRDGKVIIPKKKNFIDEAIAVSKGNYSKEKHDQYIEYLQNRGKPTDFENPQQVIKINKDKDQAKFYRHPRSTYLDELIKNEKKSFAVFPHMEAIVEELKEKIKRDEETAKERQKEKEKGVKGTVRWVYLFLISVIL
jgi:hypothetical protein